MEKINGVIKSSYHNKEILYDVRYQPDGRPKVPVIFIHGFKGFKDWGTFNILSEYFAGKGFVFVKFNFSMA